MLLVVGRVLGLRVDADRAVVALGVALREGDHLLERGDPEACPLNALRALGQRLDRAQRADLLEREVGGEPALLGNAVDHRRALAVGELGVLGHVGGGGDVRLVAGDQVPVLGGDQVRLDVVRAELDRERVAGQRVVGQVAGGAAVADDQRCGWSWAAARRPGRGSPPPGQRSGSFATWGSSGGSWSRERSSLARAPRVKSSQPRGSFALREPRLREPAPERPAGRMRARAAARGRAGAGAGAGRRSSCVALDSVRGPAAGANARTGGRRRAGARLPGRLPLGRGARDRAAPGRRRACSPWRRWRPSSA